MLEKALEDETAFCSDKGKALRAYSHPIDSGIISVLDRPVVNSVFNKYVNFMVNRVYGQVLASAILVTSNNYSFHIIVILGLITIFCGFLVTMRSRKEDSKPENVKKEQEIREKYEALCGEGEKLISVCRGYKEYYILTDQRLFIEGAKGEKTIDLDSIKTVKFLNASGGKVHTAINCMRIVIKAESVHTLYRQSGKFDEIAQFFVNGKTQIPMEA